MAVSGGFADISIFSASGWYKIVEVLSCCAHFTFEFERGG
jgi:hypothetical protein